MTTLNARPAATYFRVCTACDGGGTQIAQSYAVRSATTERRWGGPLKVPCPYCLGEGCVLTMTPPAESDAATGMMN